METILRIYSIIATLNLLLVTILYARDSKMLRGIANRSEERAGHHFAKLWNIDRMITEFEKSNGLNPHYLIQNIKKELERPLNRI